MSARKYKTEVEKRYSLALVQMEQKERTKIVRSMLCVLSATKSENYEELGFLGNINVKRKKCIIFIIIFDQRWCSPEFFLPWIELESACQPDFDISFS